MSTALVRAVAKAPWWRRLLAWLGGNARARCGPCAVAGEDVAAREDGGYCHACWLRRDETWDDRVSRYYRLDDASIHGTKEES